MVKSGREEKDCGDVNLHLFSSTAEKKAGSQQLYSRRGFEDSLWMI
jgi:hypothetical protein